MTSVAGDPKDSGLKRSLRAATRHSTGDQQTERNEEPGVPPGEPARPWPPTAWPSAVYDVDAAYPQFAWQIANDRSRWSSRRMPIGGSWGTMQPAAASINGEVDLLTYWYTGGMQEAILR